MQLTASTWMITCGYFLWIMAAMPSIGFITPVAVSFMVKQMAS